MAVENRQRVRPRTWTELKERRRGECLAEGNKWYSKWPARLQVSDNVHLVPEKPKKAVAELLASKKKHACIPPVDREILKRTPQHFELPMRPNRHPRCESRTELLQERHQESIQVGQKQVLEHVKVMQVENEYHKRERELAEVMGGDHVEADREVSNLTRSKLFAARKSALARNNAEEVEGVPSPKFADSDEMYWKRNPDLPPSPRIRSRAQFMEQRYPWKGKEPFSCYRDPTPDPFKKVFCIARKPGALHGFRGQLKVSTPPARFLSKQFRDEGGADITGKVTRSPPPAVRRPSTCPAGSSRDRGEGRQGAFRVFHTRYSTSLSESRRSIYDNQRASDSILDTLPLYSSFSRDGVYMPYALPPVPKPRIAFESTAKPKTPVSIRPATGPVVTMMESLTDFPLPPPDLDLEDLQQFPSPRDDRSQSPLMRESKSPLMTELRSPLMKGSRSPQSPLMKGLRSPQGRELRSPPMKELQMLSGKDRPSSPLAASFDETAAPGAMMMDPSKKSAWRFHTDRSMESLAPDADAADDAPVLAGGATQDPGLLLSKAPAADNATDAEDVSSVLTVEENGKACARTGGFQRIQQMNSEYLHSPKPIDRRPASTGAMMSVSSGLQSSSSWRQR
eukprot:Rmarinus@m.7161